MNPQEQKHYCALELNKVLEMLAAETACADACRLAKELEPVSDAEQVRSLLQETDDAYILIGRFGAPSFGGISNRSNALRRAEAGAVLSAGELLGVASLLSGMRGLGEWRDRSGNIPTCLDGKFSALYSNKYLEEKIQTAIISEDEISDFASNELASIRRKIRNAESRVREQLDKMIRSATYQKYLQDAIVTQRDGRYVVPVKSEWRNEISGLIHDTSSSGATVFIEPMAVVEANNDIRILKSAEKEEIERILKELSEEAGSFADSIVLGYENAVAINLIFAKAQLAYKMKASKPTVNEEGRINLKKARHPLLDQSKAVPITVELGYSFDTLVITGPNTGGKTVSLKTIGLLTLMTMCGLLIPVSDQSEVAVFDKIFADIGDEQSIEQSLSTFSSHMKNIIKIMERADSRSLILMDELGAGTDPVEGAALARAILEKLREKDARVAATTHYAELKEYALQTSGVENACCEFDVSTLRPTYRLLIGVPGRSNAFAISERLGMMQDIVERARELVSGENARFEEVVEKLEKSRMELEEEKNQVKRLRIEAERSAAELEKQRAEQERIREREIEKAKEEARNLTAQTRAKAEELLGEIEDLRKKKEKVDASSAKAQLRAGVREMESAADPIAKRENEPYRLPRPLRVGDNVTIYDIDKKAIVMSVADSAGMVEVQAGIFKMRVPISNLRLIGTQTVTLPKQRTVTKDVKNRIAQAAKTEVDLRGNTVEEALMELDRFIDTAVLANMGQISIIHGKGTGALRAAVQQHLKKHPNIKSFRLGVYGEGEHGVTVAELK